jgi:hypothetical protein
MSTVLPAKYDYFSRGVPEVSEPELFGRIVALLKDILTEQTD